MRVLINHFIRFCITGTVNAIIDFAVYVGLTRFFSFWHDRLVWATVASFIIANINGYFMNKYWTFRNPRGSHSVQYPKFILVSTIGLAFNALFFSLLIHIFHLHDLISKVIVACIVLFWNFTANKLWTFIHHSKDAKTAPHTHDV